MAENESTTEKTMSAEEAAQARLAREQAANRAFADLVMLARQDPVYRNYALSDLDWLVIPAVVTGNLAVARQRKDGAGIPVAAVTWARVSEEVYERLKENPRRPVRLSPEEYVSGDIHVLAHAFGPPEVVRNLIASLTFPGGKDESGKERPKGPLAGKELRKLEEQDKNGAP
jgi:cytolysin-activating lysine-acyltransferase